MSYFLAALTIWLALQIAGVWLIIPSWTWWLQAALAGVGLKLLIDGWHDWWLGFGIGALAVFLGALSDLVLVATDAAKVHVLRNTRSR